MVASSNKRVESATCTSGEDRSGGLTETHEAIDRAGGADEKLVGNN